MKKKKNRSTFRSLKLAICIFLSNTNSNSAFAAEIGKNTSTIRSAAGLELRELPMTKKMARKVEKVHAIDLNLNTLKAIYSSGQDLKSFYRNKKDFNLGILDRTAFNIAVAQVKVISQLPRSRRFLRYMKFGASYWLARELSVLVAVETAKIYYDFADTMAYNNIKYRSESLLRNQNNLDGGEHYLN